MTMVRVTSIEGTLGPDRAATIQTLLDARRAGEPPVTPGENGVAPSKNVPAKLPRGASS